MDDRDQPPLDRGRALAQRIGGVRDRFEWTRAPSVGPDVSVLGDLQGKHVVELGCGGGHNLAHLVAIRRARGVGVDHDARKVERARLTYGTVNGLDFVQADASVFLRTQSAASVDVCLSIFGAFSFSDPGCLAAAAAHALRPGGLLAVTFRETVTTDLVMILRRR